MTDEHKEHVIKVMEHVEKKFPNVSPAVKMQIAVDLLQPEADVCPTCGRDLDCTMDAIRKAKKVLVAVCDDYQRFYDWNGVCLACGGVGLESHEPDCTYEMCQNLVDGALRSRR